MNFGQNSLPSLVSKGVPVLPIVGGGIDHDKPVFSPLWGIFRYVFGRDIDVDRRVGEEGFGLK